MPLPRAQSVLVKSFLLTETQPLPRGEGILVSTPLVSYRTSPVDSSSRTVSFPLVRTADGALWPEACLFLVSKFQNNNSKIKTCSALAKDLALYRRYLDEEGLDFRYFPSAQYHRVTYRYRGYLKLEVESGNISIKTARRKISTVISFYKWMRKEGVYIPENSPWVSKQVLINIESDGARPSFRKVETTDLSFKASDPVDFSVVTDGGRLRPLSDIEQSVLIRAIYCLNNPEMFYAHLIALFSGARIQTVLTIRLDDIMNSTQGPNGCAYIKVGPGTGVDTKRGGKYTLLIDWALIERLKVYGGSKRYEARRRISFGERFQGKEYFFLSNRGTPYFKSYQDPGYDDQRHSSEGAAVRQFIIDRVRPLLNTGGQAFSYSFHDLRATFVMNLFNSLSSLEGDRKMSVAHIREYLRFRLGQVSHKALDSYMKYNELNKVALQAQQEWEGRLDAFLSWASANE